MNALQRLTIVSAIFSSQIAAKTPPFEVVAVEYPPFTTVSKKSGGIAFELLKETLTNSDISVEPLFLPPARAALYLRENPWCGSFYPPSKNDDYSEWALSTEKVRLGLVRLKQQDDFKWTSLEQFRGLTAAKLRSSDNSDFSQQFTDAGIELAFAESPQAIVMMVLLSRVDLGLFDSWSYKHLEAENKAKLQFSNTSLLELPVTLFVHQRCIDEYRKASSNQN